MPVIEQTNTRALPCLARALPNPPPHCHDRLSLNIHHLELLYYVARHGGISRAVRNMPYGIQQPAVSSQILLLEEDLGVKLFNRSPFKLTPAVEELYGFAYPFFDNVATVATWLRQKESPLLRIGASEIVLRDYMPAVIDELRQQEPKLRLALRSGLQADVETWLLDREIDLAVIPLEKKPLPRLNCQRLLRLPLVLLVHRHSTHHSAAAIWAQGSMDEALISLPSTEVVTKNFKKGLRQLQVDWPHTIEASSMGLVTRYVANGYGVGVSIGANESIRHPDGQGAAAARFRPRRSCHVVARRPITLGHRRPRGISAFRGPTMARLRRDLNTRFVHPISRSLRHGLSLHGRHSATSLHSPITRVSTRHDGTADANASRNCSSSVAKIPLNTSNPLGATAVTSSGTNCINTCPNILANTRSPGAPLNPVTKSPS